MKWDVKKEMWVGGEVEGILFGRNSMSFVAERVGLFKDLKDGLWGWVDVQRVMQGMGRVVWRERY